MSRQRSLEKILASEYISIGELARITGCRYSTLKFYAEEGILPFEQAEENLTRRFLQKQAVERLALIQTLRKQGLTMAAVKQTLLEQQK